MSVRCLHFFFNATATTDIYTLSLHDALPIFFLAALMMTVSYPDTHARSLAVAVALFASSLVKGSRVRSEEHTSELQSRRDLVCRLLLEKKKDQHEVPDL